MHKKRLLKLADFLETVPRKSFDMGSWQATAATKPEGKTPGECGFAGCAIGWAIHGRLFRGFTFNWAGAPTYASAPDARTYGAIAAVFAIDGNEAFTLFNSGHRGETPKQVAKRIRKFVETGHV